MRKYLPSAMAFLFLIVIWEGIVRVFGVEKYILPSPILIFKALMDTRHILWQHSIQTIKEALLGFGLAIALGTVLAVLMNLLSFFKKTIYPLVVVSQTIPIMALAPLLVIWFGYGTLPKVIVVTLVCFFPITVSLVEGLDSVEPEMIKLLLAMGASPWQIFITVRFPGAMPSFFSGLKISAAYSIMGAVIGEWLGASRGLGVFMTRSMHSFLTERVFASIIIISLLSLILFGLIELLGRVLMPWNYRTHPWQ